jgi:hypothetical protein
MYQTPIHRTIKLNIYPLLKTLPSEESSVLWGIIETDLKSTDPVV